MGTRATADPAGYSGTPLPKKLGIREGSRVLLADAPEGFRRTLGPLPPGVAVEDLRPAVGAGRKPPATADVVLLFADRAAGLRRRFPGLAEAVFPAGGIWACWPKKASGVPTDLDEGLVRAEGLAAGLVDNKVCAVDGTWSGLRFVWRLADRIRPPARRGRGAPPAS